MFGVAYVDPVTSAGLAEDAVRIRAADLAPADRYSGGVVGHRVESRAGNIVDRETDGIIFAQEPVAFGANGVIIGPAAGHSRVVIKRLGGLADLGPRPGSGFFAVDVVALRVRQRSPGYRDAVVDGLDADEFDGAGSDVFVLSIGHGTSVAVPAVSADNGGGRIGLRNADRCVGAAGSGKDVLAEVQRVFAVMIKNDLGQTGAVGKGAVSDRSHVCGNINACQAGGSKRGVSDRSDTGRQLKLLERGAAFKETLGDLRHGVGQSEAGQSGAFRKGMIAQRGDG